jgi:hypothetical protein
MHAMFNDVGFPNVSATDWQNFRNRFWPRPIEQVIGRDEAGLPDWFVPLARGVAIAGDRLLHVAGNDRGVRRPLGWRKTKPGYFKKEIGWDNFLLVRDCVKSGLWTVERLGPWRQSQVDEVLVFTFGWTPIFTRTYQAAMRLAMHCQANGPPFQCRWFKADFERDKEAVEIARQRKKDEAVRAIQPQ